MLTKSAIAIDTFAAPVVRTRAGAGQFVGGIWQPGSTDAQTIAACVHAVSPEMTQNLPEGIRTEAEIVVYSRSELRAADEGAGTVADIIEWQGEDYKILQVWNRVEGSHFRAVAGRVP